MIVLGLSAYFHDAAAALVVDGEIVAAAQEERFSRIKHDERLPTQAARFCLERAGLRMADVDHVVFYEKPLRKLERILVTHLRELPRGAGQFTRAMARWLTKRLWTQSEICRELDCSPDQLLFCEHHLSHAASSYLCSPFDDAAVLTVDGVGEWATTSIYAARTDERGSSIDAIRELRYPHSIGLLYSSLTAYLGFEVNEGEYKVMGLAAWGEPRFEEEIRRICRIEPDGALHVDGDYLCYARHATKSFTPKLEALLGPARVPGSPLSLPARTDDDRRFADVAASLQKVTEDYLLSLAREAHRATGSRRLCLAGGVALNSVANRRIVEEGPFDEVFVQPAAGDAGGALGAALWATHVVHGSHEGGGARPPRRAGLGHAFLGADYDSDDIERFLADCRVEHVTHTDDPSLFAAVAGRLARGQVGGWLRGRFEWGPRALGGRSILADPRDPGMRDRVNRKIKYRESFRPFAPAVLADEASRWFALPQRIDHLTPFMLSVVPVTEEGRARLPAVTHVDGTARVQTVIAGSDAPLAGLLEAFRAETGVGVLLNTSMNLKDEPLCASPAEAFGVFARSDLDFLVLERCVVDKTGRSLAA